MIHADVPEWIASEQLLKQSLFLLVALRDPSRHDHQQALDALKTEVASPEFVLHMLHIFTRGSLDHLVELGITNDIRQLSGLLLKNYSFPYFGSLSSHIQIYFEKEVLHAVSDPVLDIRRTACILLGKIASTFSLNVWSPVFNNLMSQLDMGTMLETDGALTAIKLICEDACDKLVNKDENNMLSSLIPKLIGMFRSKEPMFRLHSIECIIAILAFLPASVVPIPISIPTFIQELSQLANDPLPEIRKRVCESITILAAHDLSLLGHFFPSVCEFMLMSTSDAVEAVALEACEFWSTLVISKEGQEGMQPYLPRLIPLLISRMKLTEPQIILDRIEEEEQASGEKSVNIKPLHYRGKHPADEDSDDGEEVASSWTIRRQSAAAFDNIAVVYDSSLILPHALACISALLQTDDVWNHECAMLALGALSSGCMDDLGGFVVQVYPYLLESLSNSTPEVRSIACWTLGRFSYVIIDSEDYHSDSGADNLSKLVNLLLQAMVDGKPKVQSAACSSLCTVIEDAGERMRLYVLPILQSVNHCFQHYGIKNSLLLCDTIGTLADTVGEELARPAYSSMYLGHLMKCFETYDDFNMYLFPIMECLTSVIAVIGSEFHAFAHSTLDRCLRIVNSTMSANAAADVGQWSEADTPPKDFAICALDVISSLAEGFGAPAFGKLIEKNENNILELLFACMKDSMDAVRQSAFSLAGDLSKSCTELLLPVKSQLFMLAIGNLDPDIPMVCNNASWTIGELAIRIDGNDMVPFIPKVMQHLIFVVQKVLTLPETLKQNVAITIGRLCVTNTDLCAEYLPEFFISWCRALRSLSPSLEQEHAFTGLCAAVSSNPLIFSNTGSFDAFILACASLESAPKEPLSTNISNILRALLSVSEHNWNTLLITNKKEVEHLIMLFHLSKLSPRLFKQLAESARSRDKEEEVLLVDYKHLLWFSPCGIP